MFTSIFQNPFYQKKPFARWAFIVDFSQFVPYTFSNFYDDLQTLSNAVINCSWPQKQVATVPVYYAGVSMNVPARYTNNGQLDLTFNESEDLEISNILNELFEINGFTENYINGVDGSAYRYTEYNGENIIRLFLVDSSLIGLPLSNLVPTKIIEFHNCWISSINAEEFSYESEDVLKRTAKFEYAYMIENTNPENLSVSYLLNQAKIIADEAEMKKEEDEKLAEMMKLEAEKQKEKETEKTKQAVEEAEKALESIGIKQESALDVPTFKKLTDEERKLKREQQFEKIKQESQKELQVEIAKEAAEQQLRSDIIHSDDTDDGKITFDSVNFKNLNRVIQTKFSEKELTSGKMDTLLKSLEKDDNFKLMAEVGNGGLSQKELKDQAKKQIDLLRKQKEAEQALSNLAQLKDQRIAAQAKLDSANSKEEKEKAQRELKQLTNKEQKYETSLNKAKTNLEKAKKQTWSSKKVTLKKFLNEDPDINVIDRQKLKAQAATRNASQSSAASRAAQAGGHR